MGAKLGFVGVPISKLMAFEVAWRDGASLHLHRLHSNLKALRSNQTFTAQPPCRHHLLRFLFGTLETALARVLF